MYSLQRQNWNLVTAILKNVTERFHFIFSLNLQFYTPKDFKDKIRYTCFLNQRWSDFGFSLEKRE